jgi:hypothetical protein
MMSSNDESLEGATLESLKLHLSFVFTTRPISKHAMRLTMKKFFQEN